ncbi:MAG: hypothetical protein ABSE59_11610 [Opitutaceae bacterium]|jgi:hypothetical protein
MALKRSKPKNNDNQLDLDLFAYAGHNADHADPIRDDGRETLAAVPAQNGQGTGIAQTTSSDALGSGGKNRGGIVVPPASSDETGNDGATSARSSLGIGAEKIHLTVARNGDQIEPPRNQANYRVTPTDTIGKGSPKQKCRANIRAIRLLRTLETEQRAATNEEKSVLFKYLGWGGIPQVFDRFPGSDWADEREQLQNLLTKEEFEAARASTLNAHYTSPEVIRGMYAALQRFGFKHGRILEPACGIGHFLGCMPDEMHSRSTITGIEIDPLTTRIAKALYPDADMRNQPFEETKLADGFYDAAISNVPFGDYKPFDPRFNSFGFSYGLGPPSPS